MVGFMVISCIGVGIFIACVCMYEYTRVKRSELREKAAEAIEALNRRFKSFQLAWPVIPCPTGSVWGKSTELMRRDVSETLIVSRTKFAEGNTDSYRWIIRECRDGAAALNFFQSGGDELYSAADDSSLVVTESGLCVSVSKN